MSRSKADEPSSQPVELSPKEIDKLGQLAAALPHLMQYPHHAGSMPVVPTEQGIIKANSLQAMGEQTSSVMSILGDFVQLALRHASAVKDRVDISRQIYDAQIAFVPQIGKEYFLYERASGERLLSLVAPEEWNGRCPFKQALARVKLLADHTWEVLTKYDGEIRGTVSTI